MMSVSTSISTSGLWAASGVETPLELLLPSGCTIAAFLARPVQRIAGLGIAKDAGLES